MYSYLRTRNRRSLVSEAPAFLIAFVIAELFYKFHSFTLECLAFLFTWFVFDGVFYWLRPRPEAGEPMAPR